MTESELILIIQRLTPQVAVGVLVVHVIGFWVIRSVLHQRLLSTIGLVVTHYTPSNIRPTIGGILLDGAFKERHVVAGVYELVAKNIITLAETQEQGRVVPAFECRYPVFQLKEMGLSLWQLRLKSILFQNDTLITGQVARERLVKGWNTLWKDLYENVAPYLTVDPKRMFWRRLGWGLSLLMLYGGIGYIVGYVHVNAIPFICFVLSGFILLYASIKLPFPWYYTQEGYSVLAKLSGWRQYYVVEHERAVFEEDAGGLPELYAWSIIFHGSKKWDQRIFSIFSRSHSVTPTSP